MIKAVALAAAGAIGLASAATAVPAQSAPLPLVHTSWGCGPGWHPNGWGRCVPDARYDNRWGWGHRYRHDRYRHHDWDHDGDHDRWR